MTEQSRTEHELRYLSLHFAVEEFLAGRISRGDLFKTAHGIYSEYESETGQPAEGGGA